MIAPGTKVTFTVVRDGKEIEIPITLGELADDSQVARSGGPRQSVLEGLEVDDLTPQVARQLGLPRDVFGVVVTSVSPSSSAAFAGLRRGDVIQEVNRKSVTSAAAFERAVRQAGDEPVLLLVNRGGSTLYIVLELK